MLIARIAMVMSWLSLMVFGFNDADAQTYPSKPIRLVTGDPGGGPDFNARMLAPGLTERLGEPVIVVNIGGGIRSLETVANAPRDGYNILLTGTFVRFNLPDAVPELVRDFSPISLVSIAPTVLAVHPSLPVKSVKELIALAKANPGQLNFAAGNLGAVPHLAGELFKAMAGVNIMVIPYRGQGPALNALMSGEAQLQFPNAGAVMPYVKSGRVRALAVGSAEPSALTPGLPTLASSGLPGYESVNSYAVFALAKTPATIISRLNQETVRVLNQPEVRERFLSTGVEPIGSSPEVLLGKVKSEIARVTKLVREAGIKLE